MVPSPTPIDPEPPWRAQELLLICDALRLVGTSLAPGAVLRALNALNATEPAAPALASVLLLGEPGTGKELLARALHLASPRREAPFVKLHCAAIPEALLASELFGHEPGAVSGAGAAHAGGFEQADGGSLLLGAVHALPQGLQSELLRTLQQGTVQRLGGTQQIRVDVRLLAATPHGTAEAALRAGLRQDLFEHLHANPVHLPALRGRPEDIRLLALHVLHRANHAHLRNVHLSPAALELLQQQDWPGNLRELAQVIECLVLLTDGTHVSAAALQRLLPGATPGLPLPVPPHPSPLAWRSPPGPLVRGYLSAHSHTAEQLEHALALHGGNQSRTARALGLTVRQFGYRLRKARG